MPRGLLVVFDGLGDRPISSLGGLTPLEIAKTPNLDTLARRGVCGLADPLSPGIPVGTDVGHLCILGYDPYSCYSGRGPIEAIGSGISLLPGDIAFRANFATVGPNLILEDRRAGRIREGTHDLASAIDGLSLPAGITAIFRANTEHRASLVLRCADEPLQEVPDTDPGENSEGVTVSAPAGNDKTSIALREFLMRSHEILNAHPVNLRRVENGLKPANYILTRGAGRMRSIEPLASRDGISGAAVAGENTVLAQAEMIGFDTVVRPEFTANLDTDVDAKVQLSLEALETHALVLLHFKGTDIAGHDNKPFDKVRFIERVDQALEPFLSLRRTVIAVTSDHSTPCEFREHSGDPVPVIIAGPGVRSDDVLQFGERTCGRGGLGRLTARQVYHVLIDLMGFSKKYGA